MSDDLHELAWSAAEEWDRATPGRGPNEALVALIERTCRAAVEAERARCEKAAMDVLPDTDEHARSIRQSVFAAIRAREP